MTTKANPLSNEPIWLAQSLHQGYVHQWLVAGPLAQPIDDLDRYDSENFKAEIASHYHTAALAITQPPLERASLNLDNVEQDAKWHVVRCDDDHFVNCSAFYHTCHYLETWAFCHLQSPTEQEITLALTTNGPADLWLNGQHVQQTETFDHQIPHSTEFAVKLQSGDNPIAIRFCGVAVRECPNVMALQVVDHYDHPTLQTAIPTSIAAFQRRQQLESCFAKAYLDRDNFTRDEVVQLYWPENDILIDNVAIRVQTPSGRIYSEQHTENKPIQNSRLGRAYQYKEGNYQVFLMPYPDDYYGHGLRVDRAIDFRVIGNEYAQQPYGTYTERRIEALQDAAQRGNGLYSEIAKMALGDWSNVQLEPILTQLDSINQRADCSDFHMVGLLGMVARFWDDEQFPDALREPIQSSILDFKYWMDEPGEDAMCYWSENHQILFHTCQILAGQLLPDEIFSNTGKPGQWHQEQGQERALSWLKKRARGGFQEWDSNTYFEHDVLALSHLVDLAESDEVHEMAAVILDKLLFTQAMSSFKGVFGSTHGRTYTSFIKGAYLEPTSGVGRLMWGQGIFNAHIMGTVSLACADAYELPLMIEQVATHLPTELWSRECHQGALESWCDRKEGTWAVNKVTYKTPDYMLCSAQDYHPGEAGYQQHIWQATFSPDAVVFVTHPPCLDEDNSHRPNSWHGNATLPRVAQWKDVLVAVHKLPEGDWLDFTHAYFPVYAFDEWTLREDWAFAQVGDGYLALTAAQGLQPITQGRNAQRELRSLGMYNVWFCHMGRAALDGTFAEFQAKILALDLTFDALAVHTKTLRDEQLNFGWEGPLLINGQAQPLSGFKHYDSPYCEAELDAETMDIRFGDQQVRLHF